MMRSTWKLARCIAFLWFPRGKWWQPWLPFTLLTDVK